MTSLFSRQSFRSAPTLTRCLVASLVLSAMILIYTKADNGVFVGYMTDHFHHSRATWTFFVLGTEVYTHPYGETAPKVFFGQPGIPWPNHPVAYPPGMFVVFTPLALLGRFVPLPTIAFGKIAIAYLTLIMHAALWAMAMVSRRLGSRAWMGVIALIWFYSVRTSLLGFYDGAWLLTAALAVHAMAESRPTRAVVWFVVSALISYRAACLAPIAAVAIVQMLRGPDRVSTKALVIAGSSASAAVVVACFRALVKYGPSGADGAHGLENGFLAYTMLAIGFAVAVALAWGSSLLVGACIASSSVLAILHAGHSWHGYVCIAPVLALPLARRRPLWTQMLIAVWLFVFLHVVFLYSPFGWIDEVLRFISLGGREPR